MLSVESQHKIEQLLLERELLTVEALDTAKLEAGQKGVPLLAYISERNLVSEEDLTKVSALASNVPYVSLLNLTVSPDVLKVMSRDTAQTYKAVPFGRMQGRLAVAMLDPTNIQAVDYLSRKVGETLTVYLA